MYENPINSISSELKQVDEKICNILSENRNFLTKNFLEYILTGSKKIRSTIALLAAKAFCSSVSDAQI
ncbi:MAG: hypothetical protein Q4E83_02450, partial [bacterium]|nr:hypothetical protein [bacterium]